MYSSATGVAARALRLAAIREDISSRLWFINQGMESAKFNALIDSMADLQERHEDRMLDQLRLARGRGPS
ncbi:MAG: hypothetical protein ABJE47_13430 [bacterium]